MAINTNDVSNTQKVIAVKGKNLSTNRSKALSSPVTSTDRVTITETASSLKHVLESISEHSAIDRKRVEHIKRALDEGSYRIDSLKIAQKLISFEEEL